MNPLRLETMSLKPQAPGQKAQEKAEKVANQFEAVFVKTLVSSLRQTASLGGEEGGMFGQGPGADTYASWFDDNVANELARSGGIGIASSLLEEMTRDQKAAISPADYQQQTSTKAARAQRLADGAELRAAAATNTGGIDVR